MRIVVIGATGHVGNYLIPMLDRAGHEVVTVSRGRRAPYDHHAAFDRAKSVVLERGGDHAGFAATIAGLKPDVVIDMICFRLEEAVALAEALRGSVSHLLVCGTIAIHGPSATVSEIEEGNRKPSSRYGAQKLAITEYLEQESRAGRIPATVIHPGHITGPGWLPINPAGNFNVAVIRRIARGDSIQLPHFGMETLHHVHAWDVAGVFLAAIDNWSTAVGHSFHAVSAAALTFRGYAEMMYRWAGHAPVIEYLPWREWATQADETDTRLTESHLNLSPSSSMEKAQRLLDFEPRYSSIAATEEAADWLRDHDFSAKP